MSGKAMAQDGESRWPGSTVRHGLRIAQVPLMDLNGSVLYETAMGQHTTFIATVPV